MLKVITFIIYDFLLYKLFIDESGDDGDYFDQHGKRNGCSSRFFTIGGIIVHYDKQNDFENIYDNILATDFPTEYLPFYSPTFALHYVDLRNSPKRPYGKRNTSERGRIADKVFNGIKNLDCHLISATIDLINHCQYSTPAHPRFYSLLLLLERFQYFLEEHNSSGKVIYESFQGRFHKKLQQNYLRLSKTHNIPNPSTLDRIDKNIIFKRKHEEVMLQFADFFASVVWIRSESLKTKTIRYDSIKHKYYNLDHPKRFRRGNYQV